MAEGATPQRPAKYVNATRDEFNKHMGWSATFLGIASLFFALRFRAAAPDFAKYAFVGAWTLVPPIYFWLDWVYYCKDVPADQVEGVRHMHDLSRNIWIALVVVLVALFDLSVFKSG